MTTRLPGEGFRRRYQEARRDAELLEVPAVAVSAVVGDLAELAPVVERCRAGHWAGTCDVLAHTSRPELVPDPDWRILSRPDELVRAYEDEAAQFPLLVVDVPGDLPPWLRPLLDRLRSGGVGLVRYVLAGEPSDEDLATWHGGIGRPAVLDLPTPLDPARVLELVDRGEPLATIAGVPVSAQLLLALRSEVGRPEVGPAGVAR